MEEAHPHGNASISIKGAHTVHQVFAYNSHRVDANTADGWIYQIWADNCAKHLKKVMEKK